MDVHAHQHFAEPVFRLSESAAGVPCPWIAKCAEHHVPERQVRVVEGVHTLLVMNAVTLRPLKNEAEPVRCANVPVIHELRQAGQKHREGSGLRSHPDSEVEDRAREQTVDDDLERVLVETGYDLYALGTMVHLVKPAPEKTQFVTPPVPPVVDEGDGEIADDG